ncbi:MAG: hypothetical protein ACRDRV_05700 [Pseudonocardiaceae bacterium]
MSAGSDLVDLADPLAAAVRACPAVAGLHGGQFGQATTYLPGRRVVGVGVSAGEIVVGVIGRYPASVAEIAGQVRAAVATMAPDVPVTVRVEDIALPGEDPPTLAVPLEAAPPEKERPS